MTYRKALTFNDKEIAHEIMLNSSSPRKCKALGKAVKGFDEKVWNRYKEKVVEEGSYFKFTRATGYEADELKKNSSLPVKESWLKQARSIKSGASEFREIGRRKS
jgi:predicted NAD-dependent protein-ADP-ribosyltransferase YbiA (DUF1768 family)